MFIKYIFWVSVQNRQDDHVPRYCQIRGELLWGYSTEETARGLRCFLQKEA